MAHVVDFLQCSELFAIKKSTVHLVLCEFVQAMNHVFYNQIRWAKGDNLSCVMEGLHGIQGAIDVAQIHIQKSMHVFASDYYSFKSKAYNMQMQGTFDHRKRFLDVFIGMSSSMNDTKVLQISSVYKKVTQGYLFNGSTLHEGIRPYIINDKGYPLPWLMVPHKHMGVRHSILQALFNKQFNRASVIMKTILGF